MDPKTLQFLKLVKPHAKFSDIKEFLKESDEFEQKIHKAPTSQNWIKSNSKDPQTFMKYANESYPILHEKVLVLCQDFLNFKLKNGSQVEKKFYENLTILDLIDRLIKKVRILLIRKRPLSKNNWFSRGL